MVIDESALLESPASSRAGSRRGSMAAPRPVYASANSSGGRSLSRRSSLASGPFPITKAEYSGPATPSLLSRAGSPTIPLMNDKVQSRKSSFAGEHPGHGLHGLGHLGGLGGLGGFTQARPQDAQFIASLDCGTTSTRFIVFDENAKIITEHQTEFEQILPHAGWHEQDPIDLVDAMRECINRAMHKLEFLGWQQDSVKGIGITNQRETTVCWSRSTGQPLCNAIVWDDTRTVSTVKHMENKLEKEGFVGSDGKKVTDRDGLVAVTGIPLSTYFSAVKLRWMLDHYKEVREAHDKDDLCVGTVDTWLVYNLTGSEDGGLHIIDVTNASRTLLMDLSTLQWHEGLLDFFGFNASMLPKIVSSAEVYGNVSERMDTALTGVPIAGIAGDQQAALVGNKCLRAGEAKNTYGTGSFVLFNTGDDIVTSKNGLITTVAYQAGPNAKPAYALEGSIAVAGSAIKWLRDQVNLIEESSQINMLAGSVPDTGGVYFVTAFAGLLAPYWDRHATGTLIGMTLYTTAAHIARATLEAVCFQTRAVLDVIEAESGETLDVLKVDGGLTNSDVAMQIQADIGGFKVCRPAMRESTALGSAILAGHALGLFGWDLARPETLANVNTADTQLFEPQIDAKRRAKLRRGWTRAVERAREWHTEESDDEEEELERQWEKEVATAENEVAAGH